MEHHQNPASSASTDGCTEFVDIQRRRLFEAARRGAFRIVADGAAATTTASVGFARGGSPSRDVLVFCMLRGGMDGLSFCVPHADPDYASMRGGLAVPPPGSTGGALDLDGFFGLHPAASALMDAYSAGDLALVHTAGSTDPTRSHFDAMKFIEGGVPNQNAAGVTLGWLGKHLAGTTPMDPGALLRGLALDNVFPLTLAGAPRTLNVPRLVDFDLEGYSSSRATRQLRLRRMYERDTGVVGAGATAILDNIDSMSTIDFAGYTPSSGATYPDSSFGDAFKSAAALIKADRGVEAIQIDRGNWDHHDQQGVMNGTFNDMIGEFAETLAAFRTDLGALNGSVTVVCMTEFGRRVDANGSAGTDHGRASCMVVMGGHVEGGRVLRDWSGLDPNVLDDLALPVRIDYRDVLVELLRDRMGDTDPGSRFPGHTATDLGLFRS